MRKIPNILVVGDLMIDHYLWGSCDRISPEAPVPVVVCKNETKRLGGAGNVVGNLIALDANVSILSVVGDDLQGRWILDELSKKTAHPLIITQIGRKTSQKSRIMAVNQQVLRIDDESVGDVECEDELINLAALHLDKFDIVLFSDYGKGVLTQKVSQSIINLCAQKNIDVLVDPKGTDYKKYSGATLLTPNKKEASEATNIQIHDEKTLQQAATKLKEIARLKHSLITISEDGIALLQDQKLQIFPAIAKEVYDVTGAGDSVLATLGHCLACGEDIAKAIKTANLAAAVVVGKVGSADASWSEIDELKDAKTGFERKIKSIDELKDICQNRGSRRIVFTNGCFDILHVGHVKYLEISKTFGDLLIVGLNSDRSVKALKGSARPINTQSDRAFLLAALECVDFVCIFDEDTPYMTIKTLMPDTLVKGADYEGKEVVGSQFVKDVRLVEFMHGKSTTNIINKIKA